MTLKSARRIELHASLLLLLIVSCIGQNPSQVMVALTGNEGEMVVQYVTFNPTKSSNVKYGIRSNNLNKQANGVSKEFIDPEPAHTKRYIHNILITGLEPDTTYYYQVGCDQNGWSKILHFKTIPPGDDVVDMIVYGDLGLKNAESVENILYELSNNKGDLILHTGDFAYDLFTNNGTIGDMWLDMMQPIASQVPYMGCLGNHEMKYNGTHYTERFSLYNYAGANSGSNNNWFFSWDYKSGGALVHMVAITTEVYYVYVDNEIPPDLVPQMKAQYEWLKRDLKEAKERGADWIFMYGHRPMYCSNVDDIPDCTTDAETLRTGYNGSLCPMEVILEEFGVDVYITAHEHSYERLYPVYNGKIDKQENHTYVNPKYPVHIIAGAAGNQEGFDRFDEVFYGPWSVVRSSSYGYAHLVIHNSTHLYWKQYLFEDFNDIDDLWIIKESNRKPKIFIN